MHQASGDDIGSQNDAAVKPLMYSVPGLEHWAIDWQSGVVADEVQLGAGFASDTGLQDKHFAAVLLALVDADLVLALGKCSLGVFCRVADFGIIDEEVAVYGIAAMTASFSISFPYDSS